MPKTFTFQEEGLAYTVNIYEDPENPGTFLADITVDEGAMDQRWSCFFDQNAAQLRWIRVSHQAAIFMGSVLLAWTSSGVNMPWVEWGRSAL